MTRSAWPLPAIARAPNGASAASGDDVMTRMLAPFTAKPATGCILADPARATGGTVAAIAATLSRTGRLGRFTGYSK